MRTRIASESVVSAGSRARTVRRLACALALIPLFARCETTTEPEPGTTRVVVTPGSVSLSSRGATATLEARALDASGTPTNASGFGWTSSNHNVATVSGSGRTATVTATGAGTATITASLGSTSGDAVVTVSFSIEQIAVAPNPLELVIGGVGVLSAVATDAGGAVITGPVFEWTSSDASVATVDGTGRVTALGAGTATVSARSGGRQGTSVVIVRPVEVDSVHVQPDSGAMTVGAATAYTVRAFDASGTELFGRATTWTTANGAVATVGPTGTVTGVALGATTVTATVEGVADDAIVAVTATPPAPVDSVHVQPDSAAMTVGAATAYTVRAFDANGTELFGRATTWTTANGAVATVGPTGTVTGVAVGATTVTATVEGVADDAIVVVTATPPAPVDSVHVQPDSAAMTVGAATAYTVRAFDASGTELFGRATTWTTANGAVATVGPTGTVTGVALGATTVTATVEGVADDAIVLVTAVPPPSGAIYCTVATGSISAAAEIDSYTFTANAGDIVSIALAQTAGFDAGIQARATLLAPSTSVVGAWLANSQPEFTLTETGTYTVQVDAEDGLRIGDYSIGLEGVLPACADATALTLGDRVTDAIDAPADVDEYTFSASAGDIVSIGLAQITGFDAGIQARAVLFDPNGTEIQNWLANAQPEYTLPSTGTYLIQVQAENVHRAGTYALGLEGVSPVTPGATALSLGSLVTDAIDAPADVDEYTFSASAGDVVSIALAQITGFDAGIQARAVLFDPNGTEIQNWLANAQPEYALPSTGTYLIQVQAEDVHRAGTYALGLEGVSPVTPGATALSLGSLVTDAIDAPADVDEYTFTASAGDIVSIALAQITGFDAGIQARAVLFDPNGTEIQNWLANAQPEYTLPSTGTYLIQIQAENVHRTGTYALGLEGVSPVTPGATALTLGATHSGTIDAPADVDVLTFAGTSGSSVTITLTHTGGFTAGARARVTLFSPAGAQVLEFDATGSQQVTLGATGTFVVQVKAANGVTTGSYDILVSSP